MHTPNPVPTTPVIPVEDEATIDAAIAAMRRVARLQSDHRYRESRRREFARIGELADELEASVARYRQGWRVR
jgi:hypothetical protein